MVKMGHGNKVWIEHFYVPFYTKYRYPYWDSVLVVICVVSDRGTGTIFFVNRCPLLIAARSIPKNNAICGIYGNGKIMI